MQIDFKMTIQEAKNYAKNALVSSPTPALDAEVLLQFITKMDKTHLLLNRDFVLSAAQTEQFLSSIEKRKTGLPIAYITNRKEFYGFDFFVNENVLIPKPDTEILVEKAIFEISKVQKSPLQICDMCCGSACIGISVLKTLPRKKMRLTLSDISENALAVAQKNAQNLLENPDELIFVQSDLFENIAQKFDFVLTNPPYIPSDEAKNLLLDGRNEPILALDGLSDDGLGIIRRLIPQIFEHLKSGGIFLMETGEYNAEKAAALAENAGFCEIKIHKDLEGQNRVVQGKKRGFE